MSVKNIEAIITPISFRLDNAIITIYEVNKSKLISGDTWYHVHLDIRIGKYRSQRFTLDVRNMKELKKKLLVEISKFKMLILLGVKT